MNGVAPILQVEHLSKAFGGLQALWQIDFALEDREIVCLIGPNGSGKTTLFNLITGFLRPDSGRIVFMGKDIAGLKPHRICYQGIARTFQLVKPFSDLTVLQNVMSGRLYGPNSASNLREAMADAERILDFTGLLSKKMAKAGSLTLPDRKRLEVARALATKPKLLLLDEIMAGLNPKEIEDAVLLARRIRDSGTTLMVVEHVLKAVMGISDRIIVLDAGQKIAEGSKQEVVRNKRVIEAYLGQETPSTHRI